MYTKYMLDHHIQREIIYRLAFADQLRFSELKPDDVENKLFTYHLKKVLAAGFADKTPDGAYRLTPEGQRIGKGVYHGDKRLINRAYSVLFLAVRRRGDGAWLLYRRRTHPLRGLSGFMHAQPSPDRSILETAAAQLTTQTGLTATFRVGGSGFFRIYQEDTLESFTNFTLLITDDAQGELQPDSEVAEYFWETAPDWRSTSMLPSMPHLVRLLDDRLSFIDETIRR